MMRDARRRFVGIIPLAGDYWIQLASLGSVWCVARVTADGLAPYVSGAMPISVGEEDVTVRIQLDSAAQLCISDSLEE